MSFGEGNLHEQVEKLKAELEAERKKKRYEFIVDGKCESCTERRGYYMDAETIQNQQEHIAELENVYSLLQSQFDITRERWMKRGEYIAKQRERIEKLEARIGELARENAELKQVPRHVDDSPRCPLRDSMTGEMGACDAKCAWLMTDSSEPSMHACAIAVMAYHTGEQMTEYDKNTWVIENEVND
jgi:hypothetical protein